jgi:thiol-disulfide isomerase/thioredoxin
MQVMVHFSAYWCVPSIAMNPFFEELASTYQDVLFLKVDVDEVKVIFYGLWRGRSSFFICVFKKIFIPYIPLSVQHRHFKLKACLVSDMF